MNLKTLDYQIFINDIDASNDVRPFITSLSFSCSTTAVDVDKTLDHLSITLKNDDRRFCNEWQIKNHDKIILKIRGVVIGVFDVTGNPKYGGSGLSSSLSFIATSGGRSLRNKIASFEPQIGQTLKDIVRDLVLKIANRDSKTKLDKAVTEAMVDISGMEVEFLGEFPDLKGYVVSNFIGPKESNLDSRMNNLPIYTNKSIPEILLDLSARLDNLFDFDISTNKVYLYPKGYTEVGTVIREALRAAYGGEKYNPPDRMDFDGTHIKSWSLTDNSKYSDIEYKIWFDPEHRDYQEIFRKGVTENTSEDSKSRKINDFIEELAKGSLYTLRERDEYKIFGSLTLFQDNLNFIVLDGLLFTLPHSLVGRFGIELDKNGNDPISFNVYRVVSATHSFSNNKWNTSVTFAFHDNQLIQSEGTKKLNDEEYDFFDEDLEIEEIQELDIGTTHQLKNATKETLNRIITQYTEYIDSSSILISSEISVPEDDDSTEDVNKLYDTLVKAYKDAIGAFLSSHMLDAHNYVLNPATPGTAHSAKMTIYIKKVIT